jgi:TonB family protein
MIPPGIVYQEIPRPRMAVGQTVTVSLVLVINEYGRVERAFIGSMPVLPGYEQQLLAAAKTWRYTPAFKHGRAIACRKTIRVEVPASDE